MTTDDLMLWLDETPRYTWEILEHAAKLISKGEFDRAYGALDALCVMSGFKLDVVSEFASGFAEDNYEDGERIW